MRFKIVLLAVKINIKTAISNTISQKLAILVKKNTIYIKTYKKGVQFSNDCKKNKF